MNIYDSEKITSILENKGLKLNKYAEDADLIVFNTCNIRDKAAHKLYSDIGRVNKYKKEQTIAVVGCVAQAENSEMFNKNKSIDIILGPQSYHLLPQMIDDLKKSYKDGISWGDAKEILFKLINEELNPIRSKFEELKNNNDYLNDVLNEGAKKARLLAQEKILAIKEIIGISKIN